jgi:hypothetical protein
MSSAPGAHGKPIPAKAGVGQPIAALAIILELVPTPEFAADVGTAT